MPSYFNNIERIAASDYQPTVDDVLRSRVRTSGIITEQYEVKGHIFECAACTRGGEGERHRSLPVCVAAQGVRRGRPA